MAEVAGIPADGSFSTYRGHPSTDSGSSKVATCCDGMRNVVRWLDTPQPRPQRAKFPPERIRTGDSRSALGPDTGSAQIQLSFRGVPAKIQPTLKRTAEDYLSAWQVRPGRKPLVVRGARQVGKTYLIEAWGAAHFESVVTVDLEREQDLHSLFSQQDPQRSLEELSVLKGSAVRPGKTSSHRFGRARGRETAGRRAHGEAVVASAVRYRAVGSIAGSCLS